MTKQEIIKKYEKRKNDLKRYIESAEDYIKTYKKYKQYNRANEHKHYLMGLIIESNTIYDFLEDLEKLESEE